VVGAGPPLDGERAPGERDGADGARMPPLGRDDTDGARMPPLGRDDTDGARMPPLGRDDTGGACVRPLGRDDTDGACMPPLGRDGADGARMPPLGCGGADGAEGARIPLVEREREGGALVLPDRSGTAVGACTPPRGVAGASDPRALGLRVGPRAAGRSGAAGRPAVARAPLVVSGAARPARGTARGAPVAVEAADGGRWRAGPSIVPRSGREPRLSGSPATLVPSASDVPRAAGRG